MLAGGWALSLPLRFYVCGAVAWVRALHNGDMAVALLNTGTKTHDITVQLSDVVCARCVRVTFIAIAVRASMPPYDCLGKVV